MRIVRTMICHVNFSIYDIRYSCVIPVVVRFFPKGRLEIVFGGNGIELFSISISLT